MTTVVPRIDTLVTRHWPIIALLLTLTIEATTCAYAFTVSPAEVFINEIHYDNSGTDANEAIEIAGPAGADLSGWSLVLYNGTGGAAYDTRSLSGTIPNQQDGFGTLVFTYPANGIQNGAPDAVALVNGAIVVQFLSYEGSFTAVGGPANGVMSTDIGVSETGSEALGQSLQLRGTGSFYQDFVWTAPSSSSLGMVNAGQTFQLSESAPILTTCPDELITQQGVTAAIELSATEGVVTVVLGNGFFIQDPVGDGDVATSDGIFVFTGGTPTISPGDLVRVFGTVVEFRRDGSPNDLTLTELSNPGRQITVIGSSPLPTPVAIDAPDELINPDGILYWERLEGMYVVLDHPVVVGSTATIPASAPGLTEFYLVAGPDAMPGSGFQPDGNLLLGDLPGDDVDYNPERLLVDDESRVGGGSSTRIVEAGAESFQVAVAVGDTFTELTGIIDYQFSQYRLQPAIDPESLLAFRQGKPGVGIDPVRTTKNSEISIASFNVENFFDAVDDPDKADSPILTAEEIDIKAAKLTIAIADELRCPDILVLIEIEEALVINGDAAGHVPGTNVTALVPRLASRGCPYVAVSREASDDRSIEVGFLYRTDRDIVLKSYYLTTEGDPDTPAKPDTNHVFDGKGQFPDSREPLVGEFEVKKRPFIIIGNHWNSKGGDDALYGINQPPLRVTEEQRQLQATYVREYLNDVVFAADPKAAVVVAGDLNDFPFPEPGEGEDPLTILKGSASTKLTNLIERVPDRERYTFIFQGNSQVLDHLLVSEALLKAVEGIDIATFNVNYGLLYGQDISTAASSSDHNPSVIWLKQSQIKTK